MRSYVSGVIQQRGSRFTAIPVAGPLVLKIGYVSDCHYDPEVTASPSPHLAGRNNVLDYLANFKLAMDTYQPHLIIHAGDKIGASNSNAETQLAWYQAAMDAMAANSATVYEGVSPANHDFEFTSFSQILAKHTSNDWMADGTLYGYWETDDYRFVSLDANYAVDTQNHLTNQHVGYGYINTNQLTWLEGVLSGSTKPVVVNVHQIAAEFDTDQFYLTKEIYHVQNRAALRTILEASGKVIAVIQGHLHFNRADIINGIPYFTCPATVPGTLGPNDIPETAEGEWLEIDLDRANKTIATRMMGWLDGEPKSIYSQSYTWGAYAEPPNANQIVNPAEFRYVENKRLKVASFPVNVYLDDPRLTDTTIRIQGRDTAGQHIWDHTSQSAAFTYKFGVYFSELAGRWIRTPLANESQYGVHVAFGADGGLSAYSGATLTGVGSYLAGQWYQVVISVDPVAETYSVTLDDVAIATDYAFQSSSSAISKLVIATNVGEFWIDSLRIE